MNTQKIKKSINGPKKNLWGDIQVIRFKNRHVKNRNRFILIKKLDDNELISLKVFEKLISSKLSSAKLTYCIVDRGLHWAPGVSSKNIRHQSHWWLTIDIYE